MNLTSADVLTWPSCSPALVQGRLVLDLVFGLDTASGRPDHVVSLVSRPVWGPKWMSTDTSEGDPSVELVVTPGQGRR